MKKELLLIAFLMNSLFAAQVGINTNMPKATLEVTGKPNVITEPDGIIPPSITRQELINKTSYNTNQRGAILYVKDLSGITNSATKNITTVGMYIFNGIEWNSIEPTFYGFKAKKLTGSTSYQTNINTLLSDKN